MESIKKDSAVKNIELKDVHDREFVAKGNENMQVRQTLGNLQCENWPQNVDDNETEAELFTLKTMLARKEKEHLVMRKSNEELEREVEQLTDLAMRYKISDEDSGSFNAKEFEENRVLEQLLISNDDLTKECQELTKKLSETNGALAILEENMDNLRADKLRQIEKSSSLAAELALSQAKVLHLEQLARVEIRKMMSETSSQPSGSYRQNTSIGYECSSLRSGSVRQSASLELESVVAKTKQKLLAPTCVKERELIQEIPPPNTEKESHKTTELKVHENNQPSTYTTEAHDRPLSPTVLIKEIYVEDSKILEGKSYKSSINNAYRGSSINFHDMDDEQLCQYQIKLLEARDNHDEKIDMNPEELEAEIEELNLYLSGEAVRIPETVPSRPCSVKFLSRGWGMTLTKARAYFTGFHGVTGVQVVKDVVVVAFNTPEDAWAVVDKDPHVVTGCHLVPGPVTMLEDEDGVKEPEGGANMIDEIAEEVVPAGQRTVEFFMIGKVINEDLLKSIAGVESFSIDGKRVRLVFGEKVLSEAMLKQGSVVVGGEKMTVGRVGQLGWVEVMVTGGTGLVDPLRLPYLLQNAGLSPLLDIQNRGGGRFGVVLENKKCEKMIKKGTLRLGSGFVLKVESGEKRYSQDLGVGEELAGKMVISSEENLDTEGSSALSRLKNARKDINDNVVEDAGCYPPGPPFTFPRSYAGDSIERKNEVTAKDSLLIANKCPRKDDEFKPNKAINRSLGCSSTGTDDDDERKKCARIDDDLKPIEALNRSLGCSSSGTDDDDEETNECARIDDDLKPTKALNRSLGCSSSSDTDDEDDCTQHIDHPANDRSVVEVVKMSLARSGQSREEKPSLTSSGQSREENPVEDEAGYRSLDWSSATSLNDSVEDEDTRDGGVRSEKVVASAPIKVVRIALAPSRKT